MSHETVGVFIILQILRLISGMPEKEVLDKFYISATGVSYADDRTGLYGQSALYVFGLFCEEYEEE